MTSEPKRLFARQTCLSIEIYEEIIDHIFQSVSQPKDHAAHADLARVSITFHPALIYDNIASLRRCLFNCSLVCKAWLPRARHHLFSTVLVTSSLSNKGESRAKSFTSLLAEDSTTLTRCIKALFLTGCTAYEAAEIFALLPAVPVVHLINVDVSQPCISSEGLPRRNIFPSSNSVHRLNLSNCNFISPAALIATLNQCPKLVDLTLRRVKLVNLVHLGKLPIRSSTSLRTLSVDCVPDELWLQLHLICPTLSKLVIGAFCGKTTMPTNLCTFMSKVALTLKHLFIPTMGGRLFPEASPHAFGLEYLGSLESIHFHLISGSIFGGTLSYVPAMLLKLPHGAREVVVDIDLGPYTEIEGMLAWREAERILLGWPEFERMVLRLGRDGGPKTWVQTWAETDMKDLCARNMFVLEVAV